MRGVVFVLALVVCAPPRVDAQSLLLTESEALARVADGPRARATRADVAVAEADVLVMSRWPNPRLTIDRESVAGATEYLTMVSQPLPISGRRGFEVRSASALTAATTARADDGGRRLRTQARFAFADLVAAQDRERITADGREKLTALAVVLERREAAGDAAGYDRLRVEREVVEADVDVTTAGTERRRAQAELAGYVGIVTFDTLEAAGGLASRTAADAAVPSLDALLEKAESTRGALTALRHEADAARLAARAAERRRLPEPEVVGGTKSSTVGDGDVGSVVMVHLSVPLFDRARPERAMAAARLAQADVRADAFRQALRGEVGALRETVLGRRTAAARYRDGALSRATELERIAGVSYDAGERGILELLDAYRVAASTRLRQLALDAAARDAEIELEYATGWEMPR